jgi:hypothetical protein
MEVLPAQGSRRIALASLGHDAHHLQCRDPITGSFPCMREPTTTSIFSIHHAKFLPERRREQ